ncbi:MAG: DUF1080 domain-containing protein [Sedimentisphaerales bacterium]|nr:DUF1080 domain-containing protein [Sedimentisphaerales bacterium]
MKNAACRLVGLSVLTVFLAVLGGCHSGEAIMPDEKVDLFNGRDFTGWKLHVDEEGVDMDDVWSVKNGVINCKGVPNGYMRTEGKYKNYVLHVEWRWVGQPTNSGVLLHSSGKDKVWPRTIEAQLKAGSAGDFVLINGTGITVDGKDCQDVEKQYVGVPKKEDSSENPVGRWNAYDIICKGNEITLYVNEVLQNKGTNATDTSGWICLQSEGSEIEFRNIYIKPIDLYFL